MQINSVQEIKGKRETLACECTKEISISVKLETDTSQALPFLSVQ